MMRKIEGGLEVYLWKGLKRMQGGERVWYLGKGGGDVVVILVGTLLVAIDIKGRILDLALVLGSLGWVEGTSVDGWGPWGAGEGGERGGIMGRDLVGTMVIWGERGLARGWGLGWVLGWGLG